MNKIILFDINEDLCKAWEKAFKGIENVECGQVVAAGAEIVD